jgi:DNA-binding IclR family transcriptional regulator
MAAASVSSNKAKIARRVIEVLDYFDDDHREATVMDIVRRYDRPQSSTSELLSSLVELGLLYKNPHSRSYSLTPRAALIGASGQSDVVRQGRLVGMLDRLVAQTGLSVALFGRVCLNAQIISWRSGARTSATRDLYAGLQAPLSDTAAGWLLLSTVTQPRRDGIIRRLNAEASDEHKFVPTEMAARLHACRDQGHVQGAMGYGSKAAVLAVLLPGQPEDQPLAVGFVYGADDTMNAGSLLQCLDEATSQLISELAVEPASVERLSNAA